MVRSEDCIGHTVDSIYTSGVDTNGFRRVIGSSHLEFTPLTLPDPVSLHLLDPIWPIEIIDIGEESLCVLSDPKYPLADRTTLDACPTSVTGIIGEDFFIGKPSLA